MLLYILEYLRPKSDLVGQGARLRLERRQNSSRTIMIRKMTLTLMLIRSALEGPESSSGMRMSGSSFQPGLRLGGS